MFRFVEIISIKKTHMEENRYNKQLGLEFDEFDVQTDNISDSEDLIDVNSSDVIVYSRDWTIETIYNQIILGNIDLNPNFQRRNAWTDEKRSKLIESIVMGYPVPEIVLAENPVKKRSYIVIDGKQRLLTIAGFINNSKYLYWDRPKLKKLDVRKELNGLGYEDINIDVRREFDNSSLRCTVITGFSDIQVLYDIFYRLNSGSVSLSTQELRQSLIPGDFANYLLEITNEKQPIHDVMNIEGPDRRFRDIEIVLRLISFIKYPRNYNGNLKKFLDESMKCISDNWNAEKEDVTIIYEKINGAIGLLNKMFGEYKLIGRKYEGDKMLSRFNKVLFEVEVFFFLHLDNSVEAYKDFFISNLKQLCSEDAAFKDSIESSTKNMDNYRIRYSKFQDMVNRTFNTSLSINPFQ